MAAPVPTNQQFLDRYPEFSKASSALVTTWIAAAARRTSANLFEDGEQTTDAVCLKAAVLLTKSPQARALKLVSDEQAYVWANELYELQRSAGMGLRIF